MWNDHQWPLHHVSSACEIIWFFGGNNVSLWTYGRRHVRAIDFARFGMRGKTQDQSGLGRVWYWSIEYSFGSFLGKILRWDRPCVNKSISIFHCNSVLFSQASNFHTSTMEDTDHKDVWQCGTFP